MSCPNRTGQQDSDLCEKYCIDHQWEAPCEVCKKPMQVAYAVLEVKGQVHDGCAGYPFCSCKESHQGDCATTSSAPASSPAA